MVSVRRRIPVRIIYGVRQGQCLQRASEGISNVRPSRVGAPVTDSLPPVPTARRINGERIVLLGWSRAILMQLAHPLVAAGVHDHSTFRGGAFTGAMRLHHTVRAMLALTFGDGQRSD